MERFWNGHFRYEILARKDCFVGNLEGMMFRIAVILQQQNVLINCLYFMLASALWEKIIYCVAYMVILINVLILFLNSLQQTSLPTEPWDASVQSRPEHSLPLTWSAQASPLPGGLCEHLWVVGMALHQLLSKDPSLLMRIHPLLCQYSGRHPRMLHRDLLPQWLCGGLARSHPDRQQIPTVGLPSTKHQLELALHLPSLMYKPELLLHPKRSWDHLPQSVLVWLQFHSIWEQHCREQSMILNSTDSSTTYMREWFLHVQIALQVSKKKVKTQIKSCCKPKTKLNRQML